MSQHILKRALAGGVAPSWHPALLRRMLLVQYALFSVTVGLQSVLWGEVQLALGLADGLFGTAMAVTPLTGFLLLVIVSPRLRHLGQRRLAVAGLLSIVGAVLALSAAQTTGMLLVARILAGLGFALLESSATNSALDWEEATGRSLVGTLYGLFSAGMVTGALLGGALLWLGLRYTTALLLLVPGALLTALATSMIAYPPARSSSRAAAPPAPLTLLRSGGFLALVVLCLLAVAGEALADLWAVIYLRALGANPLISGVAFALFNGAMIVGRLASGALRARLGARGLLWAACIGVAGAAGLLALGGVPASVAAFGLLGLAIAGVVPTVLGAARAGSGGAAAVSGIVATTYLGFVLAPPLIGWLAEHWGLQAALLLCLGLISLGIAGLTPTLPGGRRTVEE